MTKPKQGDLFVVGRKSATRKPGKPRLPDLIFEGLVQACGYDLDRLSKVDRQILNPAAQALRDSGVPDTEAGRQLILKVAAAYRADPKLKEQLVGGQISPMSLAKHWHALVQVVKPRQSEGDRIQAAICREITVTQKRQNADWWQRRRVIAYEIVHRDPQKSEAAWLALKMSKPLGMKKASTMEQWLGVVADLVSPGELGRRMETNDEASTETRGD